MTKSTRIYIAIVAGIVLACAIYGVWVSHSFVGEQNYAKLEGNKEFDKLTVAIQYGRIYSDQEIETIEDLKEQSDLVVKVKIKDSRTRDLYATKTEAEITEVYKETEGFRDGDTICIYEPALFLEEGEYHSNCGYQIMDSSHEYLIFLKHLKKIEGYQYTNEEQKSFYPTSAIYGSYPLGLNEEELEKMQPLNIEQQEYTYREVKNYPILTTDRNVIERYKKLYHDISSL